MVLTFEALLDAACLKEAEGLMQLVPIATVEREEIHDVRATEALHE